MNCRTALCIALILLTGRMAMAAVSPSDLEWMTTVPGVRLTSASDTATSLLRTYQVSSTGVLARVQAELEKRGWHVRSRAGTSALTATRDDLSLSLSLTSGRTMSVSMTENARSAHTASGGPDYAAPMLNVTSTRRTLRLRGPLTVNGGGNRLTLLGTCPALVINGSDNKIDGTCRIERVTFNGRANSVRWARKTNPRPPAVTDNGRHNASQGVR